MKNKTYVPTHLRTYAQKFLILSSSILLLASPSLAQTPSSLSDLSIESLDEGQDTSDTRNPFEPEPTVAMLDPRSLNLEGVISRGDTRLCLLSGKILRPGNKLGGFTVKSIYPGGVTVTSVNGELRLPMEGYLTPEAEGDLYEIIFQNAGLRESLRLIATAGNYNIIIPETLEGRVSLVFHDTPLLDALGSILRVNELEFAHENNIIRVGKPEEFASGAFFDTKQISLQYASAKDLVETVKSHLSDKGTITADTRTNTLIIKDFQSVTSALGDMVKKLDRQDVQIRIEAKIVDVTRNFSRSMGIQWGLNKDTGRVFGFGGADVGTITDSTNPLNIDLPALNPTSGIGILVGNLFNETDLEAQLTAAEDKGDAHIISQPSVTTVNNTAAKIRSGVKIYVKVTSTIAVGGSGGGASGEDSGLEEIDTGIELTVTPQITAQNMIKLKIDAEESEADFSRTVDGIPAVIDNTASTTVLVRDGETTVIGGLMKVKKTTDKSGVPFVSSIPVVGWLFKSKTKTRDDNELLIFITPHVSGTGRAATVLSHAKGDKKMGPKAADTAVEEPQPEPAVTLPPSRKRNREPHAKKIHLH